MKNLRAEDIVEMFGLVPLPPEGGFFRQTWRTESGTAIYYLITPGSWSSLHMLKTDEIWHFYYGDPVRQLQLLPDGRAVTVELGFDPERGLLPQLVTPAEVWQATRLVDGGEWALCGTTMAPPFLESEYFHGDAVRLLSHYPQHNALIKEFL